ncbi:hypothetical protein D3C84_475600 [compost metagenome]
MQQFQLDVLGPAGGQVVQTAIGGGGAVAALEASTRLGAGARAVLQLDGEVGLASGVAGLGQVFGQGGLEHDGRRVGGGHTVDRDVAGVALNRALEVDDAGGRRGQGGLTGGGYQGGEGEFLDHVGRTPCTDVVARVCTERRGLQCLVMTGPGTRGPAMRSSADHSSGAWNSAG